MERVSQVSGRKYESFSKELTVHVWRNLMGEGKVKAQIEKITQVYGKAEKVEMSAKTMIQFVKPEQETGFIKWKSQDQGGEVIYAIDKSESIGTEKDPKTGKTLSIVIKEPGRVTKEGIKRTAWRFSPLKSR